MARNSKDKDGLTTGALVIAITPVEGVPTVTALQPSFASRALGVARRAAATGATAFSATATGVGDGMAKGVSGAGRMAGTAARAAADVGGRTALLVGDLNGDGKVDEADFQIARAAAGRMSVAVAHEAADLGKAVLRHDLTRDAAAGAAVGALIAIPIPLVGPPIGAAFGAVVGLTHGSGHIVADAIGQVAVAIARPKPKPKPKPRKPRTRARPES